MGFLSLSLKNEKKIKVTKVLDIFDAFTAFVRIVCAQCYCVQTELSVFQITIAKDKEDWRFHVWIMLCKLYRLSHKMLFEKMRKTMFCTFLDSRLLMVWLEKWKTNVKSFSYIMCIVGVSIDIIKKKPLKILH